MALFPDLEGEQDRTRGHLEQGFGGQYRILRLLGRGGMGAVYLARDEALERLVAIKVLRPELAPSPESRERFRREALTAAQLNHPNIVPLFTLGDVQGLTYLVMGYVRGEPLSARLQRDKRLRADDARRVIADIADALDYAHRKNVIHRDVKPDNILMDDETGRALLADFGIAKAVTDQRPLTAHGGMVGTPHYMSPEQAQGSDNLDSRSDLYSLGLTAYEMLAGRPAFDRGGSQGVLGRRVKSVPAPLPRGPSGVPDDLAAAVMRCLEDEPSARWSDASALREAISPSSLDADNLPEPLDALDGTAPFVLGLTLAFLATSLATVVNYRGATFGALSKAPFAIPLCVSAVFGGLIVAELPYWASAIAAARTRGIAARQIWDAMWRQPEWWICLWYPPSLRRSGDVWYRLPPPVRAWRSTLTAFAACLIVGFYLAIGNMGSVGDGTLWGRILASLPAAVADLVRAAGLAVAVLLTVLVVLFAVTTALCARLFRAHSLDAYTQRRVLRTLLASPTSRRTDWKNTDVLRFLIAASSSKHDEGPTTDESLARTIRRLLRDLPSDVRAQAEVAGVAAGRMLGVIQRNEARIGRLVRDADGKERALLERSQDGTTGSYREFVGYARDRRGP